MEEDGDLAWCEVSLAGMPAGEGEGTTEDRVAADLLAEVHRCSRGLDGIEV